jgi:3'(2'), 5'-bisphosphate nucleotidase
LTKLAETYADEGILVDDAFDTLDTANTALYIDPLDGTSDFRKGNLPAVTVIIGVAVNGKSRAGIVHQPFKVDDETKGQTVFGSVEHGYFFIEQDIEMPEENIWKREIHYKEPFDHKGAIAEDFTIKVAASLQHFSDEMQKIIETANPTEIKRIGGAGNKAMNVVIGNADCYIHPSVGLKFWDLCAPEALIKAMGGFATNMNRVRLSYPEDGNRNIPGLLLAKTPAVYDLIVKRLGDDFIKSLAGKFEKKD